MVSEIYRDFINDMTWSYSRIKAFEDCPYRWYMRYILGDKEEPMFYSSYGTLMHKLIEGFYSGKFTKQDLPIEFLLRFQTEVQGQRPSDKIVKSYIQKGLDYCNNFEPFPYNTLEVERRLNFKVGDLKFVGILDYIGEKDGEIYIVDNKSRDLKPRSKRKKPTLKDEELDEMLKQLYLYSIPIKEKYGKYPKALCFNCFKARAFIEEPFDMQAFEAALKWATNTVEVIKNTEIFNPWIDFFSCKYICGLHDECCYANERSNS